LSASIKIEILLECLYLAPIKQILDLPNTRENARRGKIIVNYFRRIAAKFDLHPALREVRKKAKQTTAGKLIALKLFPVPFLILSHSKVSAQSDIGIIVMLRASVDFKKN
jgi:hypothetical protein